MVVGAHHQDAVEGDPQQAQGEAALWMSGWHGDLLAPGHFQHQPIGRVVQVTLQEGDMHLRLEGIGVINGEMAAHGVLRFQRRFAGPGGGEEHPGEMFLVLPAQVQLAAQGGETGWRQGQAPCVRIEGRFVVDCRGQAGRVQLAVPGFPGLVVVQRGVQQGGDG